MKKAKKMIFGLLCALMVLSCLPNMVKAEGDGTAKKGYTEWSDDPSLAAVEGAISQTMYRYADLEGSELCLSGESESSCEVAKGLKVRYIDTPMRVMANGKWLGYDKESYGTANGVEGFLEGNKYGLTGTGKYHGHTADNAGSIFGYGSQVGAEWGTYVDTSRCYSSACGQNGGTMTVTVDWSQPSSRITDGTALKTSIVGVYASGYANHGYRIKIYGSKSGEVIEYNADRTGACGLTGDLKSLCKGEKLYNSQHSIYYGSLASGEDGTEGEGLLQFDVRTRYDGYSTPPDTYGYVWEIWVVERTYFVDLYNTGLGVEVSVIDEYVQDGGIAVKKVYSDWSSWQSTEVVESDTRKVEKKVFYAVPITYSITYDLGGGDMKGDTNMDGTVDANDLSLAKSYLGGSKSVNISLSNADTDGSGSLQENDASVLESMVSATYGKAFEVPVPFREGYIFEGWTITSSDSSVTLKGQKGTTYQNLAATQGAKVSFKAQWKKTTTKVSFDLTGGKWSDNTPPLSSMDAGVIYELSKIPEREGYLFAGWDEEGVNGEGYESPYSNAEEISTLKVYGYRNATYTIANVKTDGKEESHSPWYRKVYRYNYNYKEEHKSTEFTIRDTGAKTGTVWSRNLDGYHITKFVSDIDMANKNTWAGSTYYQPKVEVKDDNGLLFVGQARNSNVQTNGVWTGDKLIHGTLYMYAYAETGSGRNWTGSGGSNYIEYYRITSKISDWVFDESGVTDAVTINSIYAEGYVLPTWSKAKGWRTTGSYADFESRMGVSTNIIFHSNGGHLTSSSAVSSLAARSYSRPGYTLAGYNTKADGSGTAYAADAALSSLGLKENEELHLYAQWKKTGQGNDFLFEKNEVMKTSETSGIQYMESYLYRMQNLRMDGGTVSFKAKWVLKEFKFTIDPNGGTINGSSSIINATPSLIYGKDNWSSVPVALRKGYVLEGYYDQKEGGEKVYGADGKAIEGKYWKDGRYAYEGNLSVYAHWKDIEPPVITIKRYDPGIYKPDGTLNYTNQNIRVTFDVGDEGSGLKKVELVHGSSTVAVLANFSGENEATLSYDVTGRMLESDNWMLKATDMSGNVSYRKLIIPNIDKQKPEIDETGGNLRCGMSIDGAGTVTLKVSDDYSGISEWSYRVSYSDMFNDTVEGSWITGDSTLNALISVPESTIASVAVRARDNAGNYNEISACSVSFNKTYSASVTLSDYGYVFGLYDSLYGKGTAISDAIASSFLEHLANDTNETSRSALRYMQTLVQGGLSKTQALASFMETFHYDQH